MNDKTQRELKRKYILDFIDTIRFHQPIWNCQNNDYKNIPHKQMLWEKIARDFEFEGFLIQFLIN